MQELLEGACALLNEWWLFSLRYIPPFTVVRFQITFRRYAFRLNPFRRNPFRRNATDKRIVSFPSWQEFFSPYKDSVQKKPRARRAQSFLENELHLSQDWSSWELFRTKIDATDVWSPFLVVHWALSPRNGLQIEYVFMRQPYETSCSYHYNKLFKTILLKTSDLQ